MAQLNGCRDYREGSFTISRSLVSDMRLPLEFTNRAGSYPSEAWSVNMQPPMWRVLELSKGLFFCGELE